MSVGNKLALATIAIQIALIPLYPLRIFSESEIILLNLILFTIPTLNYLNQLMRLK